MAEVLVSFEHSVRDELGEFHARAVGRSADDGMWEGWVEFTPIDGTTEVLVTGIESRQPEREHLEYWATGLTPVFLEGALQRARRPVTVRVRTATPPGPEPILDPFQIGARSLDILRQELRALNRPRLLNIISAYNLNPGSEILAWLSDHQLMQFIGTAVETQLALRTRA